VPDTNILWQYQAFVPILLKSHLPFIEVGPSVKSRAISLDAACGIFSADSWPHFHVKEIEFFWKTQVQVLLKYNASPCWGTYKVKGGGLSAEGCAWYHLLVLALYQVGVSLLLSHRSKVTGPWSNSQWKVLERKNYIDWPIRIWWEQVPLSNPWNRTFWWTLWDSVSLPCHVCAHLGQRAEPQSQ
jgi:hypothetical protein